MAKDRIKELKRVPAGELIPNAKNWRTHPKGQVNAMQGILAEVGWADAVLARETPDGLELIDGHLRKEVAPDDMIPVLVLDVDEAEADKILATHDPLAAMAESNAVNLEALLHEVKTGSEGLQQMLTDLAEDVGIESMKQTPEIVEDEAPEPPADPVTQPGDLWLLGDHRLLCGDSTSADDVARLMDGSSAGIMVTDPPYGVEYDPSWRAEVNQDGPNSNRAVGKVQNDDRADWTEAWQLFEGDVAYVWHADVFSTVVSNSLTNADFEIRYLIVWAKQRHTFGRGHYHHQHEPCWYMVKKGKSASWSGGRKQTTLWAIDNNRSNETGHGTQKPVECMARPMTNHEFDAVYDPFLGSGTTLIAAEQLNRKCYGLEISPVYCDVIVQRWENLTGKKASRE
tara:strand:+ start:136 stop:1329 length:1194 start_codon:yes stop_codon:yes gene_type:complete